MADIEELSLDMLEQVTGGVFKTIRTGTLENAAVRARPGTGKVVRSLPNGTRVDTVGAPVFDAATGRNWIKIKYTTSHNKVKEGWIAASIVGLPR